MPVLPAAPKAHLMHLDQSPRQSQAGPESALRPLDIAVDFGKHLEDTGQSIGGDISGQRPVIN